MRWSRAGSPTPAARVPGYVVSASCEATGVVRSATSDAEGHYAVLGLPAGAYDIRAELAGFATIVVRNQTLHVGTTITIDYALNVAGVVENVEVRGILPALESTKSALTRVVQRAEIDALPVVNRNFNDLAALSPGVTKTGVYRRRGHQRQPRLPERVPGGRLSAKRQRLGDQRMPYAQDWIEEFQVITSSSIRSSGRPPGAS